MGNRTIIAFYQKESVSKFSKIVLADGVLSYEDCVALKDKRVEVIRGLKETTKSSPKDKVKIIRQQIKNLWYKQDCATFSNGNLSADRNGGLEEEEESDY